MAKIINWFFILLTLAYGILVFKYDNAPYFNPNYAGDDARQQLFQLYEVLDPGLFEGDYIYRAMKLYTGPLHELIASTIVRFTQNPIMAGHWTMTLQFSLALMFIFLAVRSMASIPAACVSVAWLLHTPWLIRNTFGGLPRGWAGAIVAAFLYFISTKNHKAIIALIFVGSLLHPHSTFLVCAAYSFFLAYQFLMPQSRQAILRPLIMFLVFCPAIFAVNYFNVRRPADIGTMVDLKQAEKMPAFSKEKGRFPFVPLDPPSKEFKKKALRMFFEYEGENDASFKKRVTIGILIFYLLAFVVQFYRRRIIFPSELIIYTFAAATSYFLARFLAFRLYVPTRYLGWPLALFFLISMPVIIWRMFHKENAKVQWKSLAALCVFVLSFYLISGSNLGARSSYKEGDDFSDPMYTWIRENTPKSAVFAGQPSSIDGMQLYGMRRAYVTTETAHPFYDKYNEVMEHRIKVSFKALYARSAQDFLKILENEKIDYFVFAKKFFKLNGGGQVPTFKFADYFAPHGNSVRKLGSFPKESYFHTNLLNFKNSIVYQSKEAIIVDVAKLRTLVVPN